MSKDKKQWQRFWISLVRLGGDSWFNVHRKKPVGFGAKRIKDNQYIDQWEVIEAQALEEAEAKIKSLREKLNLLDEVNLILANSNQDFKRELRSLKDALLLGLAIPDKSPKESMRKWDIFAREARSAIARVDRLFEFNNNKRGQK